MTSFSVGTNGNNGGDLAGSIDDARVYNTAFTAAQAFALYEELVPEPATIVSLVGLCGIGLIGLAWRRRKAA
jgi:hypothetical protein